MKNEEFNELLRKRTLVFALRVIEFLETVPFNSVTKVLSTQFAGSSTSVGSNWRAFCRARSKNERFSKICIVVEEADESQFWIEVLQNCKYGDRSLLPPLMTECTELLRIMTSIKDSMYGYGK